MAPMPTLRDLRSLRLGSSGDRSSTTARARETASSRRAVRRMTLPSGWTWSRPLLSIEPDMLQSVLDRPAPFCSGGEERRKCSCWRVSVT